jgi:hypothetical protein
MTSLKQWLAVLRSGPRAVRLAIATRNARATPPILSPSIGRVGSTMLWQALVSSRARALLGSYRSSDWRLISAMRWSLRGARFQPGTVCKTHDFPDDLATSGPLRIVFLFGRPSDVVLSVLRCRDTKGLAWISDHLSHMHARGGLDEILDRDVLRLEEQVDAWLAVRGFDILCLKYEALWENRQVLNDFVGFDVVLPARVERDFPDLDPAIVRRARETYAALDRKIAALPDHQLVMEGVR